jgi:hypothetical protein
MSDDPFDLPERELPEHVRGAALRRIMTEIGHEPPRRRRGLAPLLIAASVVILMAGATVVTTAVLGNKDHQVSTAAPKTTVQTATTSGGGRENGFYFYHAQREWGTGAEMQRCWNIEHKPDSWQPLLRVENNNLVAMLYRVGTDIVFCQLSKEQVTVKTLPYPAPPTGTQPAKLLFVTTEGTYAGVTAPGTDNLAIDTATTHVGGAAAIGDGVFIMPNLYRPTGQVWLRNDGTGYPGYHVPAADMPQPLPPNQQGNDPRGDRTSDAGKRLGGCLSAANPPIPDADWYAPGASVVVDAQHWGQLGVLDNGLVWCSSDPDNPDFYLPMSPTTHAVQWAPVTKFSPPEVGAQLAGYALNAAAATVTVQPPGMAPHTAVVSNRTFVVTGTGPPVGGSTVTVKDSSGKVIDQFTF